MKKKILTVFLSLFIASSISFADSREGLFVQGGIGLGALTVSEADPGGELAFGLGYGFTKRVSMFSSVTIVGLDAEYSSLVLSIFGLGGLYYPAQVDGLFFGFQIGAYGLEVSSEGENAYSYSVDSTAMGPKAGYEFELAGSLSGGFDFSYLLLDKAENTVDIGNGITATVEFEDNLFSALFYLKYSF